MPAVVPSVPVSVVVSTLDRPQLLARCLDALLHGTALPAEVVVVDQGRPGPVADVLRAREPRGVRLVHVVQDRRGLSASQNAGVVRASCPVVAVVDDDCVPDRRWVEVAAREHTGADGPLLVTGRVLPLPPEGDRLLPLSSRTGQLRRELPPDALPWDVGTGGNFTVTRAAFLAVGGNDRRLGTGTPGRAGNDLDLFHRLLGAGVQARFVPDLLVLHERATAAEHRARRWTYGFGVGACVARWLAEGDRSALRVLAVWLRVRLGRLLRGRGSDAVPAEARVLLGTLHGLAHGARLGPRDSAWWPHQPGRRLLRAARHPRTSVRRLHRLLGPRGHDVRALRGALQGVQGRVLVVGDRRALERALQEAPVALDVAGTDSADPAVTVVSAVSGPGSLPVGRWDAVVVTEPGPRPDQRLAAARAACRAPGRLVVLDRRRGGLSRSLRAGG